MVISSTSVSSVFFPGAEGEGQPGRQPELFAPANNQTGSLAVRMNRGSSGERLPKEGSLGANLLGHRDCGPMKIERNNPGSAKAAKRLVYAPAKQNDGRLPLVSAASKQPLLVFSK